VTSESTGRRRAAYLARHDSPSDAVDVDAATIIRAFRGP
jgi:hypothetical protein